MEYWFQKSQGYQNPPCSNPLCKIKEYSWVKNLWIGRANHNCLSMKPDYLIYPVRDNLPS